MDLYGKLAWATGCIMIYSVTNRESLDVLQNSLFPKVSWRAKQNGYKPIALVGSDCNLEAERVITTDEGETLARMLNCPFVEVSTAESGEGNVDEAFHAILREIQEYVPDPYSRPNRSNIDNKAGCFSRCIVM
ncbi:hypothetical protein BDQ17DRAFT_1313876 [Cyathus striatus]|nr:hypothetical protein BDQ17DRAFT_1313876 [Cyathus striatus]